MAVTPTTSLLVPLTFPACAQLREPSEDISAPLADANYVLDITCSAERSTSLVAWGLGQGSLGYHARTKGAAIGGEHGSVYIFHPLSITSSHTRISTLGLDLVDSGGVSTRAGPSSHSRSGPRSGHHSRSASPSSLHFNQALLNVSPRSRAISGVSKEQVQAPKNYVDYEDEPDRLKEMLKSRNLRDRTIADALFPSFDKGVVIDKSQRQSPPSTPGSQGLGSTSAKSPSPRLHIPSPQEPVLSSNNLSLKCHMFPTHCGAGHAVSNMWMFEDLNLLLALQETGDISLYDIADSTRVTFAKLGNSTQKPTTKNIWKYLRVIDSGEKSKLILACASLRDIASNDDKQEDATGSNLALLEFTVSEEHGLSEGSLETLGEWHCDSPASCVSIFQDSNTKQHLVRIDCEGRFKVRTIEVLPSFQTHFNVNLNHEVNHANKPVSLAITNVFTIGGSKSADNVTLEAGKLKQARLQLGDEQDAGQMMSTGRSLSLRVCFSLGRLWGLVWSCDELAAFEFRKVAVRVLFSLSLAGITDALLEDDHFTIIYADRMERYHFHAVDRNNNDGALPLNGLPITIQPELISSSMLGKYQALHYSASNVVYTRSRKAGQQELVLHATEPGIAAGAIINPRSIWEATAQGNRSTRLTSILPLELEQIILGYSDGYIRQSSLVKLAEKESQSLFEKVSDLPLDGFISSLHLVRNDVNKERFIVGGGDDGSIGIWSLSSLKLCARWTVFTTPLIRVIQLQNEKAGPLRGCALCVAEDGTIAAFVIDGFKFLYLIPGSAGPLCRVCIDGDDLLLVYSDDRARLWGMRSLELWRSTTGDKAEELINQGGWIELSMDSKGLLSTSISTLPSSHVELDSLCTISLNLERFLKYATISVKSTDEKTQASSISQLRTVLSVILTPGLNHGMDDICENKLGIQPSSAVAGYGSFLSTSLFRQESPRNAWCVSPNISAARALVIVATLKTLALHEAFFEDCQTIILFYSMSLAQAVSTSYKPPDISFLSRQWFDSSNEIKQAARVLIDAGIARMSDEESMSLVDAWQHQLPCLQPTAAKESKQAALALFICGFTAIEKYSLMSTSSLVDISKSIALYLHDDESSQRSLAIDLCSRGFQIWQHYIDAMEMLRALCNLATNPRKENLSAQCVGPQARLAVLQISSSNTPLFMTTLTLDILHPRSLDHRKSIMQLVAFLIRKRPLVLYHNLPRLMEAVVKSLDPNSTASRDTVLDTATEILGQVVKTFPTVDFHMATQRLAVGTSEGAFIMYDLKTATQLYVLEGHKKRPVACSFSPDGRRLVTVSLEECAVLVWKVGSSFSNFFNPGAPPRQGHGGSQPFKTLPFNVGDEANMTIAATLEGVRFEWPADRSVKLHISESTLTFST